MPLSDQAQAALEALRAEISPEMAAILDRLNEADPTRPAGEPGLAGVPEVASIVQECSDGRIRFPESYQDYGERYGASPRTVRSWVETGKEAEPRDLPPLHHPPSMPGWFRAHYAKRVPEGIEAAAALYAEAQASGPREAGGDAASTAKNFLSDSGGGTGGTSSKNKEAPPLGELIDSIELELAPELEADTFVVQLRSVAQMAYGEYVKALREKRRTAAREWRKDWLDAVTKLRQWEKEILAIQQEKGFLVRRSELVGELAGIAGAIARNITKGFEGCVDDVLSRLPAFDLAKTLEIKEEALYEFPDLAPLFRAVEAMAAFRSDKKAQRAIVIGHRDETFRKIRGSEFAAPIADHYREEPQKVA